MPDFDDAALGEELRAFGASLASDLDVVAAVRADITDLGTRRPHSRAAAAVLIVGVAAAIVMAVPDARRAAADWFGIGRTSVTEVDELPAGTGTTAPPRSETSLEPLPTEPELPSADLVGPVHSVTGTAEELLVVWESVSLTLRPVRADTPLYRKFVLADGEVIRTQLADGSDAMWVPPGHVIMRGEHAELAGGVLLWIRDEIEYRLADAERLEAALDIANSVG